MKKLIIIVFLLLLIQSQEFASSRRDTALLYHHNEGEHCIDYIAMYDLLATINTLYLNGYYGLMEKHINNFMKDFPPVKEVFYFKAITLINKNKYDEGLKELFIALAMEPKFSRAQNAAGYIHALRSQWATALQFFREANSNNTYNAFIEYNIAGVYYQLLDFSNALNWSKKVVEHKPNFVQGYYLCALSAMQLNDFASAIEYFNIVIQLKMKNDSMYYNRALAHYFLGNYEKALNDCTTALTINKKNYFAAMLTGIINVNQKNYEKALKVFTDVLKIKKDDLFAKVFQALCIHTINKNISNQLFFAIFGSIDNGEQVAAQLTQLYQLKPVEPLPQFFLY
ncbi:MAG TPA: tetratricopeptide repeat protein [Spirochaetota bacterium]|nr:tetratricopeptide repeat protein [Spirochaetota bacterium]HOF14230.1 tetratricopeptide repeat protein [Spirochaetota bacterium]HOM88795.1 tetratricopeptide repeat protein [Spirochaetota bacterium]HOR93248.1 tetratricopeptide repeat protein [Spirochaetota bacterium]HPD06017.1 tetratricopeptide repeat protein [Spirochaetota bacterium]